MPIVKICCNEVTCLSYTFTKTVVCDDPQHTPVGPGCDSNVCCYNAGIDFKTSPPTLCFSYDAQFEYAFKKKVHHSDRSESDQDPDYRFGGNPCTFLDFCNAIGNSARIALPDGVTLCSAGCGDPEVSCSAACDPESITTTPTSVSGNITIQLTVSNLCVPTFVCVETVPCVGEIKYYGGV
jgi:hypothetical protein